MFLGVECRVYLVLSLPTRGSLPPPRAAFPLERDAFELPVPGDSASCPRDPPAVPLDVADNNTSWRQKDNPHSHTFSRLHTLLAKADVVKAIVCLLLHHTAPMPKLLTELIPDTAGRQALISNEAEALSGGGSNASAGRGTSFRATSLRGASSP